MICHSRRNTFLTLFALLSATSIAHAQQEFPPPQGKARVVVVASGMSGPEHYAAVSRELAQLGYDVVLFDGNPMEGTHGDGLKTAIQQALQMPHALPGKVALVSFSLGGGLSLLTYGIVVFALARAPIAAVSALRETSVVFAALLGHLFLGERLTARKLAACVVIALGTACIGWQR